MLSVIEFKLEIEKCEFKLTTRCGLKDFYIKLIKLVCKAPMRGIT